MKASKPPGLTNSQVSIRAGRFFRRLCVGRGQESPGDCDEHTQVRAALERHYLHALALMPEVEVNTVLAA